MNFRFNQKKYNLTTGLSLQNSHLKGELYLLQTSINRTFTNLLPVFRFNYDFTNTKRLNLDYETFVQEPTIQQLQPVVDNSDPLNLYVGNPNLRPAYSQNIRLNVMSFNPFSSISIFGNVNVVYTTNSITNSVSIDERFIRTTTPVNAGENLNIRNNLSFGFPLKKLKSRINLRGNYTYNESINLLNDLENKVIQNTVGGNIRYSFNPSDKVDISLSADLSRQNSKYAFGQVQNQSFLNQIYTAETNITLPLGFQFGSNLDYLIYQSQVSDFSQKIPLWNLSLSNFFLKAKSGELKFSVVNVLDKSIGASQNASINYLEQSVIRSLGRYYMISFTYSLNKALNPTSGRGGFRMMVR